MCCGDDCLEAVTTELDDEEDDVSTFTGIFRFASVDSAEKLGVGVDACPLGCSGCSLEIDGAIECCNWFESFGAIGVGIFAMAFDESLTFLAVTVPTVVLLLASIFVVSAVSSLMRLLAGCKVVNPLVSVLLAAIGVGKAFAVVDFSSIALSCPATDADVASVVAVADVSVPLSTTDEDDSPLLTSSFSSTTAPIAFTYLLEVLY